MSESPPLVIAEAMTIYAAQAHKQLLLNALETSANLILDLSQVDEIDTAGLQLLILTKREAIQSGKTLAIRGHSKAVREMIEFCNLSAFFGDPMVISAREQR